MRNFIFKSECLDDSGISAVVLFIRLLAGSIMLTHGLAKLINFDLLLDTFPSMLGIGSKLSLLLAIGGEVGCSLLLMFGLFARLAALAMIFVMGGAVFEVHAQDAFAVKELALLYLGVYIALFYLGPGKLSMDRLLFRNKRPINTAISMWSFSNVGCFDRAVRMCVGVSIGGMYFAGIITGTLAVAMIIFAIILITTSIIGFSLIYKILGIDTIHEGCRYY